MKWWINYELLNAWINEWINDTVSVWMNQWNIVWMSNGWAAAAYFLKEDFLCCIVLWLDNKRYQNDEVKHEMY